MLRVFLSVLVLRVVTTGHSVVAAESLEMQEQFPVRQKARITGSAETIPG